MRSDARVAGLSGWAALREVSEGGALARRRVRLHNDASRHRRTEGWLRRDRMERVADVHHDGQQLFFAQVGMPGGPAPVRRFLPHLIDLVLNRMINPGKVFDLELPLADVAEGLSRDGRTARHQDHCCASGREVP